MRFDVAPNRTLQAALFGAALAGGLGVFLSTFRLGAGLVHTSYDWLLVWRGNLSATQAVVVVLDEESHNALGQPDNAPWDRSLYARLLNRLTDAGARAVVFDIVFTHPQTNMPGADERFAEAIRRNGHVLLTVDNRGNTGTNQTILGSKGKHVVPPFGAFLDAGAGIGSDELYPGSDMVVREHTPRDAFDVVSKLSWAAAEMLNAPVTQKPGAESALRWVNHYGRPGAVPWVSFDKALDPRQTPDGEFRDKVVFVGSRMMTRFSGERKDEYSSPFTYWLRSHEGGLFLSGVELQATLFLNLLRGDWLTRAPRWLDWLVLALVGGAAGFLLVRQRALAATLTAAAGILAAFGISLWLVSQQHIWFPWLIVAVQITVALAWSVLFNSFQYYAQKRLMEHTVSLYVSPKLVAQFSRNPKLLKPGAEKQLLTIVFTDIENFTTLAQDIDSDELAEFMNRYFQSIVGRCIHPADGTVVKYIGDGVFSFWNAPLAQPDHAYRACDAALRMRELDEVTLHGKRVRTRIGIHTGEANVGNFGSLERVDYTALGENVNLASRLEGLNKFVGTGSLISAETRAAVGDRVVARRVGLFTLKGFSKSVEAFELVGRPDAAEKTRGWRETFEQALRNFEGGNFEFATMGFRAVLESKPDDGPTKFYLQRIEDVSKEPLEGDWTGVTMLKEK